MLIFTPDYLFEKTTDITPGFLHAIGVKNLILDVDNTLTTHDNPTPGQGVPGWLDLMRAEGLNMMIVSNNHRERVTPFADMLGLPFCHDAKKPLSKGINEALSKMKGTKKDTVIIGDQILTDGLAAHLRGMKILQVMPIEPEKTTFFKFKRRFEKPFIKKYLKKHGGFAK